MSRFYVSVDAIGSADNPPYYILPGKGDESDLNFQEYSVYIKNAFKLNNLEVCDDIADANTVVFLFYDISDPIKDVSTYSIPIFGQTGVSSTSTYGTLYGNKFVGYTYSGTTTYTPTYGITGYRTQSQTTITYLQNIALFAFDKSSIGSNPKQLWKTEIQSEGSCGDLRVAFPYIIAASYKYIGQNTQQKVATSIRASNPVVGFIKNGSWEQSKGRKREQPPF